MQKKVISISNQKGGVGKTTTAVNLGASLAVMGKRVLLLDLDSQANASSGLGVKIDETEANIYHVMIGQAKLEAVMKETSVKDFFVAPSHTDLIAVEVELLDTKHKERVIKDAIAKLDDSFDYVLIDCPPSLGLLTLNALTASNSLIIPVQCEYYALEGLKSLLNTFQLVKRRLNSQLDIEGFLLTMFDPRTRLSHDIADNVRTHFGDKVFETVIPRNIRLCEAPSFGLPIVTYDIASKGAQCYLMLANEIIASGGKNETQA